jgi:hypothetical protein
MKCPACGSLRDGVLETRLSEDGACLRRRRKCRACDAKFTTHERVESREETREARAAGRGVAPPPVAKPPPPPTFKGRARGVGRKPVSERALRLSEALRARREVERAAAMDVEALDADDA